MSILVLGTVALDSVKTPYGQRTQMLGGSAVHFSMSSRLFTKVHLAAIVGKDFPKQHIKFLQDKGVILDSLLIGNNKTFHWQGEYAGDLNSAITKKTQLGVLTEFCPKISPFQRKIKYIFLANVDPDIQMQLINCLDDPKLIGLDSMNFWINNKRKALLRVIKKANIYVANDQEARSLSQEYNLIKAAKFLSKLGPQMILIKKGEHGVLFYNKDFIFNLPAYPTESVIDPTGAGDTFAGGFMGYLARVNKHDPASIKRALVYGTIVASYNVEAFGLERTQRLCLRDLEDRISRFKKIVLF